MDLNFHVKRGILLSDRTSLSPLPELLLAQRNEFPIDLWLLADGDTLAAPPTVIPLPSPYTEIVVSARPNDNLAQDNLIFFLDNFTQVGDGNTLHYQGTLNTATAAALSLFNTATKARAGCLLDIDFLVSGDPDDGRETALKQRDFILTRALWQGTEGLPPEDEPQYPAPSALLTTGNTLTVALTADAASLVVDLTPLALSTAPAAILASVSTRGPVVSATPNLLTLTSTSCTIMLSATPGPGATLTLLVIP